MERSQQGGATANDGATSLTSDELAFASLAHFLQFTTWFIGPLVIYLVKRESRFVAFHALQALLWQGVYICLLLFSLAGFFFSVFASLPPPGGTDSSPPGPPFAFVFFPVIWLLMMGCWILTLILATVFGIKAIRGQWAAYPIIGGWARRIVGH